MDLSTEIGIQNFRRSLHIAFKDISGKVDVRQFIRRDGTIDMQNLIMSIVDRVGFNTLQIMRSTIEQSSTTISYTTPPVSKHNITPTTPTSPTKTQKINESFGCGNIKQLLDDETDD